MRDRGLNQLQLSKLSGVNQSLISKYIRNDPQAKHPSYKTMVRLAKALHCDLHDLTGLEELKGKQELPPLPDEAARALWDIYTSLPDGDTLKELLKQKIRERKAKASGEEK